MDVVNLVQVISRYRGHIRSYTYYWNIIVIDPPTSWFVYLLNIYKIYTKSAGSSCSLQVPDLPPSSAKYFALDAGHEPTRTHILIFSNCSGSCKGSCSHRVQNILHWESCFRKSVRKSDRTRIIVQFSWFSADGQNFALASPSDPVRPGFFALDTTLVHAMFHYITPYIYYLRYGSTL